MDILCIGDNGDLAYIGWDTYDNTPSEAAKLVINYTQPDGYTCSAGTDCNSEHCVDGYCCNTACDGTCQRCDSYDGTAGSCHNIADDHDPDDECSPSWNSCDSACVKRGGDGYCDGSAAACDDDDTTDYVSTDGKVCSGGSEVDPSSSSYCDETIDCVDNACSAAEYYRGCSAGSSSCIDTNKQSAGTWYPDQDYVINGTTYKVGTSCDTNQDLCGYSGYNGCNGTCQKKRDEYRCNGSGSCNYDVGDDYANVGEGYVCSSGSEVNPSSSVYCDETIDCVDNACSAAEYYRGCYGDGSSSCKDTNRQSAGTWYPAQNYVINGTTYKVGTSCDTNQDYCGYSDYNSCAGTGSPYSCQKCRDAYRCNGSGSCNYDSGNNNCTNVASGNVCSGGSETSGTCTYRCGYSGYNACNGGCQQKRDCLACDGSNACNVDVGDSYTDCASGTACSSGTCSSDNYCSQDQCRDGSGWHDLCDVWCDGSNSCSTYDDSSCMSHCDNWLQDCDETGVDTGGSCPAPSPAAPPGPFQFKGLKMKGLKLN